MRTSAIIGAAFIAAASGAAVANDTVNFNAPGYRGAPNTEYAGFESFSVPFGGPNFPTDAASFGLPASLTQNTAPDFSMPPGISISGVGNLYSGFQSMDMTLADSAAADVQDVVLQVRTLGTELFYGGVMLSYEDGGGQMQSVAPVVSRQQARIPGPVIFGNPTVNVEWRFRWDLSSIGDDVTAYSISMTHFAPHLSVDRIELDTRSIPAPSGAAVMLGLAAFAGRRRR